jgi:hypothetical protein
LSAASLSSLECLLVGPGANPKLEYLNGKYWGWPESQSETNALAYFASSSVTKKKDFYQFITVGKLECRYRF